jgi:hypothetical protein
MQSLVYIACCFLAFPAALFSRELTGTVYADHSGVSATGTGDITLATRDSGLVTIYYQKPIRLQFSDDRCSHLGAIWTVRTDQRDGTDELISARCDGAVDVPVHSAWTAVLAHLKTVAQSLGQRIGFQRERRGPIVVSMDELKVEISGYLQFPGNGMCLELKERVNDATVIIESSPDCHLHPKLDFTVKRVSSSVWNVTNIKPVE